VTVTVVVQSHVLVFVFWGVFVFVSFSFSFSVEEVADWLFEDVAGTVTVELVELDFDDDLAVTSVSHERVWPGVTSYWVGVVLLLEWLVEVLVEWLVERLVEVLVE